MVKIYSLILSIVFAASAQAAMYSPPSPWQRSGVNTYFSTGNVGINTTNAGARLTTKQTASEDPFHVVSSANTSMFKVTGAGNVGINSTAPGQLLDVQGTVRITTPGVLVFPDASQQSTKAGLTLVSNTTVSAVTNTGNIPFTNTNSYLIHAHFTAISAGGDTINFLFNNDTASVYKYAFDGRSSGGALTGGSASAAAIVMGTAVNNTPVDIEIKLFPQIGTGRIFMLGRMTYLDNAGGLITIINFSGNYDNTVQATSFKILTSGVTTFTSGFVNLYKYEGS